MLHGIALVAAILFGTTTALPCDIYAAGGTPCVAAHSTVRALLTTYSGALYQVKRASDKTTMDIPLLEAGGIANAQVQDEFCAETTCVISIIYDQSGKNNHLTPAPGGGYVPTPDDPADASKLPIVIAGKKAYGVWIDPGQGYRNNNTTGVATGDDPEAMYMLTSGTHFNGGCCFDYGNAETSSNNDGSGTMEAVYLGKIKEWNYGQGKGPWVMADLENGVYGCEGEGKYQCPNLPAVNNMPYVTAMIKGHSGGTYALKQGNGQQGNLTTTYDGPRPNGYTLMKKQGAIILGTGGDNSNWAAGSFFEGVMVKGDPVDSVDDQVQADIVAAGYVTPVTTAPPPMPPVKLWEQCGGNTWTGSTTCEQGTCVEVNDWYFQCRL